MFITCLCMLLHITAIRAACPPFDTNTTFPSSKYPPDPFKFLFGSKVATKSDWQCRRTELVTLLQDIELGSLPSKPSLVDASISGTKLTINVEHNNKRASFSVTIQLSSNGDAADGPVPAVIAYGASSVPLNGTGIATIIYNNEQIAAQPSTSSRGQGLFYTLYGSSYSAGVMMAQTWGISRIIDALELLGTEATGIDTKRIGLTGCSRNGRSVLVAGAYEPRIALTIAQEGGVGGPACWRLYEDCHGRCIGIPEKTYPWDVPIFRADFPKNVEQKFDTLPYDHHELIALHAPRGLLVLENDIDVLQPVASTVCGRAGRTAYEALGVERAFGFSLRGGHEHCRMPSSQQGVLDEYLGRYLLGKTTGREGVFESDREQEAKAYEGWGWTTPRLG